MSEGLRFRSRTWWAWPRLCWKPAETSRRLDFCFWAPSAQDAAGAALTTSCWCQATPPSGSSYWRNTVRKSSPKESCSSSCRHEHWQKKSGVRHHMFSYCIQSWILFSLITVFKDWSKPRNVFTVVKWKLVNRYCCFRKSKRNCFMKDFNCSELIYCFSVCTFKRND